MAVNENKWGLLYCPRNGWREGKRWLKIEKVPGITIIYFR